MILITLVCSIILVAGVSAQCQISYPIRFAPFEENLVYSVSGCTQFYIGPFNGKQESLMFSFTYSQLDCSRGQNIQLKDEKEKLVFDFCQTQKTYATPIHNAVNSGSYALLFFYNVAGSAMSSFIHFNKFDKLYLIPPQISINIPITTTTTTQTTTIPATTTSSAATSTDQTYSCGVPSVQPKLIGGTNVNPYSWPWEVLLQITRSDGNLEICGGSLITNQWIVTAAHCITSNSGTAYLGVYDRSSISQSTIVPFSKIIVHPDFTLNAGSIKNDIALVKLSQPVKFSNKINSICITSMDLAVVGTTAIATGWGDTLYQGQLSNNLLQVSIPIQPMSWCAFSNTDSTTQICAGDTISHKGSCSGDSGSPLIIKSGNQYYLAGVTSEIDVGCSGKGIYTRVSYYYSWILNEILK